MSREVKVGAFVFLGLLLAGIVVFLIGETRRLFEDHTEYQVVFKDIQGLKRGSPVRMGGLDIGNVKEVEYPQDEKSSDIHVTVSVVSTEARRIREDSMATIEPKGLLGDKLMQVTVGSPDRKPIPPGSVIPSEAAQDLTKVFSKIGEKADNMMGNLERTSATFAEEDFRNDLRASAASMRKILDSLANQEGYAGRVLSDPEEAERISRTLGSLERTSAHLEQTLAGLNAAVRRVNSGPGLAHELIYGESGSQAVAQFGNAAEELAVTLRGIREGNGLAHSVIYGDQGSHQMMEDLNSVTSDLRVVVKDLREGKGTLGALLVDPSVYEDLKVLLGNVQRNRTLRALVRYSINQDETEPKVEVVDPSADSQVENASGPARVGGALNTSSEASP